MYIFNKSLNDEISTSKWKDCNITPILKSDKKDIVSNWHGIALLPTLSKVLETKTHTRLYTNMFQDFCTPNRTELGRDHVLSHSFDLFTL